MSRDEPSGPDLDGVVADANAVGLQYVVIGGFAVIANGFLRATKDSDLLVPDGQETDEAIVRFLDRIEARRLRDEKVLTLEDVQNAHHVRVDSDQLLNRPSLAARPTPGPAPLPWRSGRSRRRSAAP